MQLSAPDWAALPSNCVLAIFGLAGTPKDAAAWRLACKSFHAVCGRVDMLQLRVVGDDRVAAEALDASSADMATWFGLDLDFVPMDLVQQVGRDRVMCVGLVGKECDGWLVQRHRQRAAYRC